MKNLIIGLFVFASAYAAHHTDMPSTHGMALVGTEKIYLSHLPMFHSPHDYQVILEVELEDAAKALYSASRVLNNDTVYTIAPETGVLTEMAKAGKIFRADLYRGHFERGGTPIAEKTAIKVVRVLYFKKFVPGEAKPDEEDFILFGNAKEQFGAHLISAAPDFDRLVKVSTDPRTAELLERGPQIRAAKELKVLQQLYFETDDLAK